MSAEHNQRQEEHNRKVQQQFTEYVKSYPINLPFPATVSSASDKNQKLRTNVDLVQHRLLEAGVMFDDLQQVEEVTASVSKFIANMNQSGCFNAVQVKLDDENEQGKSKLQIVLNEKNWYRLYIGGGLKQDGIYQQSAGDGLLPKVQFETSGTLLNLGGHLDKTSLSYTVDQTAATSLSLSHDRPLYTLFSEDSMGYETILSMDKGSQFSFSTRAVLDTVDHEWTRSYKEYQRLLSVRAATNAAGMPEMLEGGYAGLDWSLVFRDIIPRRSTKLPYECDASPEIVAQSGPTTKNSLTWEYRTNGCHTDNRFNPTTGADFHTKLEVAGPPGDVGFVKAEGGFASHFKLSDSLALHASASSGILHALTFGGLCGAPTVSDRFYVGGPMQLRGFLPAGIGPRAKTGGSTVPGGDALGGDLFYTATVAASVPFPVISFLQKSDVRLFCFANCGTLTGLTSMHNIVRSTRASVGGGVSMGSPFGRMEATYAVPLRCGPRDARKAVQFGLGFNFG